MRRSQAARLVCWAAVALLTTCGAAQSNVTIAEGPWAPLAPGSATVSSGAELLDALNSTTGAIVLSQDIHLTPEDWGSYDLPIVLDAPGETILIQSDDPGVRRVLDWGYALDLLSVTANTTLALDGLDLQNPGNRTKGIETLPYEIKGSMLWPTVAGENGHKVVMEALSTEMDIAKCNPDFVQVEVQRIQTQIDQMSGVPGLGSKLVQYIGGVSNYYVNVSYPASIFNSVTKQQDGRAMYSLINMTTTCYDSSPLVANSEPPPADDGGGGGTPSWVWAVVGSVLGCAALALVAAAFLWRRKRRLQAQLEAAGGSVADEEGRCSKNGSNAELASLGSGLDKNTSSLKALSGQVSSELSGQMPSQFLRTRFGPIDGVQLGELLGRGAFGRVYRGRWKGAIVAVKVIDHRVQPGKTHDLSREPLLSMSVSHPNVLQTHKMCVVKVNPSTALLEGDELGTSGTTGSSGASGGSGLRTSSGQLVPALDGSGGMVEVVQPTDVLQPGLYETWLVCEFCDKGSLGDLIATGKLSPDPSQRDVYALLCLLDVALGLEYLHSSTIIHGDLKPANVMLKAARNDRRGFVCKLGDFGLSRMLGNDQSHVETQSYGTASYAAPELLGLGKLTTAADIYSLAIIMWELVAGGQELYPGLTAMQVIVQVSQQQARPDIPEDCPPDLAELMQRCWHKDPAQRPTAGEVVESLRQQVVAAMKQQPGGRSAAPPAP